MSAGLEPNLNYLCLSVYRKSKVVEHIIKASFVTQTDTLSVFVEKLGTVL